MQRGLRACPNLLDHAREILPERERHAVGAFRVVEVLAHHPVDRIHGRRADADKRFSAGGFGDRDFFELDSLWTAELVDAHRLHGFLPAR